MSTAAIALFSDGRQMTDPKTVNIGLDVDTTFDITSQLWPVTVNQVGVWSETGFTLRDAPVTRTYDSPGRFELSLAPPFV